MSFIKKYIKLLIKKAINKRVKIYIYEI